MRKIHNFTITGTIGDDSHFIKARETYERTIVQQMRDKGYVPVLDMNHSRKSALPHRQRFAPVTSPSAMLHECLRDMADKREVFGARYPVIPILTPQHRYIPPAYPIP